MVFRSIGNSVLSSFSELLSPVHSPEKKKILEAIAKRGPRLVPIDVAAETGLALPLVISELNNIAAETSAHLEVTESGNISYIFQNNLDQAYLANASRQVFLQAWRVFANASMIVLRFLCAALFFLIRISFGIMLIVAAVAVVVLIVVAIIGGLKALSGNQDSDGPDFDFDFGNLFDFGWHGGYYHRPFYLYWLFDWLWDWFFFWRYVIPSPAGSYGRNIPNEEEQKKKGNFLNNVFSYLFGDGNPNTNFEETKWQTVARIIELNHGVVTADQLAPYIGEDPKNEDWMIPILQRYNGSPEVSESGHIIYVFRAFQNQSGGHSIPMGSLDAARSQTRPIDELAGLYQSHIKRQSATKKSETQLRFIDKTLQEEEWQFLTIDGGALTSIVLFAAFVSIGSLALLFNAAAIPILATLKPLLFLLAGYGGMFFFIPAVRYAIYKGINEGIEKRNSAKQAYATALSRPSEDLAQKLDEAASIRISGIPQKPDRTVYSTERNAQEQYIEEQLELGLASKNPEKSSIDGKPNAADAAHAADAAKDDGHDNADAQENDKDPGQILKFERKLKIEEPEDFSP